jgi:hypothetical protein
MNEIEMAILKITIYATAFGWRYRVDERDDGNYYSASDALFAAQNWLKNNQPKGNA